MVKHKKSDFEKWNHLCRMLKEAVTDEHKASTTDYPKLLRQFRSIKHYKKLTKHFEEMLKGIIVDETHHHKIVQRYHKILCEDRGRYSPSELGMMAPPSQETYSRRGVELPVLSERELREQRYARSGRAPYDVMFEDDRVVRKYLTPAEARKYGIRALRVS